MSRQQRFEDLLGGASAPGISVPVLDSKLATKLLARIEGLQWHLNCYSLELNFRYGGLSTHEFLDLATEWGFDGATLHTSRFGPAMSMTADSDRYLAALVADRGLELMVDVSSLERADLNDTVRVARALGVSNIRCYETSGGTISQIMATSIEQLKYAAELAERWNLVFLLEQHELLTGREVAEIIGAVDAGPRLGALFDFANPVPAGRDPLEDLFELRSVIRAAHSKDAIIVSEGKGTAYLGVRFGEGDLNLSKLYFDLLMLGADAAQLSFIAIQNAVGYQGPAARFRDDDEDRVFEPRQCSETPFRADSTEAEAAARLARERRDAQDHFEGAKSVVAELRRHAIEAICVSSTVSLGPESTLARAIEDIGRQIFPKRDGKWVWSAVRSDDEVSLDGSALALEEARALLALARQKNHELALGVS